MLKRQLDKTRNSVLMKMGLPVATMGLGMAMGYWASGWLKNSVPVQQPENEGRVLQKEEVPQKFERKITPGTELARLKQRYETRVASRLVERDLEDPAELPFWFRSYLRAQHPGLPKRGKYQYPLVAEQILDWMVDHPDLRVPTSAEKPAVRVRAAPSRTVRGGNINLSGLAEVNSESTVAVDYNHPQYVVAASNHPGGTWRQKQFWSEDGGATWNKTELPLATGSAFHSDPALAFTTTGDAWAATLGIDSSQSVIQVQLYKSVDHGATWTFNTTVSEGDSNDKEMIWIDNDPHSPNKDHIYVVWDVPGSGMRARISPDAGNTWGNIIALSNDGAIGSHVISGPDGEVYVGWPDTVSQELRVRKLNKDGTAFSSVKVIAKTNSSYEISIPSFCTRKTLIYLALGVDRSNGPRRGHVYAIWTDLNTKIVDPGCDGRGSDANTNIYISSSADGGNTWSTPKTILAKAGTDQFNPWLDVDSIDGSVHVIYYSTKNDPDRKKTDIYYVNSTDGGTTWFNETKVTTMMTDETDGISNRNQYGDYNGLAVFQSLAHPVWTDRRTGTPGGKEQIYTSGINQH